MNPSSPPTFGPSRRDFLRRACCAAVGSTGMLSALAQLRAIGAVASDAASTDYKALVCLFLNGGNDANNVLVPTGAADYAQYAQARGSLALPSSALLPLAVRNYSDPRSFGLNAAMPELYSLYQQGKAGLVANVGTLVQPTTLAQYQSGTALPPQLFSHSDQQVQWQSSLADQPFQTGWGGRLADALHAMNGNTGVSMSISVGGANSFQVGNAVAQLAVDPAGAATLYGFQSGGNYGARYAAMKSLAGAPQADLLTAAFGGAFQNSVASSESLSAALAGAPTVATAFPGTSIAQQLQMVARLIAAAPGLGLKRQVFFCQLYGWDLHGSQLEAHGPLLSELSAALAAFYAATIELGVASAVTTFTASDFGRTFASNGDGSDHGWGSHHVVIGGAVNGGDIYGAMPSLQVGGPDDVGRGRWIPAVSVDEYSAPLARWFGVSGSNLSTVLPNLGRFAQSNTAFI